MRLRFGNLRLKYFNFPKMSFPIEAWVVFKYLYFHLIVEAILKCQSNLIFLLGLKTGCTVAVELCEAFEQNLHRVAVHRLAERFHNPHALDLQLHPELSDN